MIATLFVFGLIFLYIFTNVFQLHRQSLDRYGENSILKVSRTYRASFFSQSDLFYWLFILMSVYIFSLSFSINNGLSAQVIVVLISLVLLAISVIYFYVKYQYWKKNGNISYTFDPILRKIILEGSKIETIGFDKIKQVIIYYPKNYKLVSGGYIEIILSDKTTFYLTSLLPCYELLDEFFEEFEKQHIYKPIYKV